MIKAGKKTIVCIEILIIFLWASSSPAASRESYVKGEVLVQYKKGEVLSKDELNTLYESLSVVSISPLGGVDMGMYHLALDTSITSAQEVIDELNRNPAVEFAEHNYLLHSNSDDFTSTVDSRNKKKSTIGPIIGHPNGKQDPNLRHLHGLKAISAHKAWKIERGSKKVVVAVLDSGVDYNHPDLSYNIWRNPHSDSILSGINASGDPITGDIVGWDFLNNDNLPYDFDGHGTHCAGTIGAVGGNGIGISGVAPEVSIMVVRVFNRHTPSPVSNFIHGMYYAVERGAHIISQSVGDKEIEGKAQESAINYARKKGVLFVTASGNDGVNIDKVPLWPASMRLDNIISVSATGYQDNLLPGSNYGKKSVHIAAPGLSILSTVPGGKYKRKRGTSMAAPHVAGAAALLWSHFPGAGYLEIKKRLLDFSTKVPGLRGKVKSGGRLNVYRALIGK